MRPTDLEQLEDDLRHFRSEWEIPADRAQLVAASLPRCLATLEMIPDSVASGDVLELGASPYLFTLCLRRMFTGRIALANYYGTDEAHGTQRLVHQRTGEELVLEYDAFNIEKDELPYRDGSFDVVIFSELIEHLAINPVWSLGEIHRILRPGGYVIVTTPNRLSLERLETYLTGGSQLVDKYSPLHGYGARHNREYHARELRDLLETTGFVIEQLTHRDLASHTPAARLRRSLLKRFLTVFSQDSRDEHIFLRARRGEMFRWRFPASLFDQMELFHLARHPYVQMGSNDTIQCVHGWHAAAEDWGERGGWVRRVQGKANAFLRAPERAGAVGVEVFVPAREESVPVAARLIARDRWVGTNPEFEGTFLDVPIELEPGSWQTVERSLQPRRLPAPGSDVEVLVELPPGTAVRRIWLRGPGEEPT